ncbi:hypothetical protein [Geosporobacter ferrireducens]|uniref:hypothetical protein n=1 Tax=Geosporobacter ferrireducens TaxID=1424294 RepID=UPI0023543BF2|nr:hypothetical protein [Geosporobacter ferrireducens]
MKNDFIEALQQWGQAKQNFQYADPEYIDIAIYQLKTAEEKLSIALKEREKGEI